MYVVYNVKPTLVNYNLSYRLNFTCNNNAHKGENAYTDCNKENAYIKQKK